MKKILTGIICSVLLLASCNDDTVNLTPIGYTEAGFFSSEQEFDWAVRGVYMKLGLYFAFQGAATNVIAAVWMLPDDDMTTRATTFAEENFVGLNGGAPRLSRFYNASYQAIQRANTVLEKQEERPEVYNVNPDLRNWHRGEALFLRSYVNFMLWNVFGTAPLITARIQNVEESNSIENSTGTALLDRVITDLSEAAELLPATWPSTVLNLPVLGRVTRNSALGLRAKALVFRATVSGSNSDYTEAISTINAISGRALMADYGQNFDALFENNQESLFEYQANRSVGNVNAFLPPDDFAAIGEISHYLGNFNQMPSWIGNSFYTATQALYDAYPAGDPRIPNIFGENPNFNGAAPNIVKYIARGSWLPGNVPPGGNGLSANNPRLLRYADVLLLKAEAIIMSGGDIEEAVELINTIRTRARNSTADGVPAAEPANRAAGADRATAIRWLFEERRLELALENGVRWFDLRRRHLASSPDLKIDLKALDFGSVQAGVQFSDFNVNFPLPNGDVQQIAGVRQNEGY